jgi:hypothetical protein
MSKLKIYTTVFFLTFFSPRMLFPASGYDRVLSASPDYKAIKTSIVKRVPVPKGYHEGLYYDGKNIWLTNGKLGDCWIVDPSSGAVISKITPLGTFAEALVKGEGESYFFTDWDEKKLYKVRLEDGKMIEESSRSLAPGRPAGAVWTGERLYVITWTRGMGTKFDLLEADKDLNILRRTRIARIEEPAHMTWDGRRLWISSWYSKRVYKIDIENMKVLGSFVSPVNLTTGIAWDGAYMWVTGTNSDLYQVEIKDANQNAGGKDMEIKVISAVFKDGEMIPKKHTCDGEEVSPPISWSGVPKSTESIALISDDPDAPGRVWVHWVIFNIPPVSSGLPEGVPAQEILPDGSRQGINDSHQIGYGSPCPPSGTHRYYFKIYALDSMMDIKSGATKNDLLKAMKDHVLAEGQIMGRYKR